MDLHGRYVHADAHLHPQRALILLATLVLCGAPALAGAQVAVEVSPLRVELTTKAGGTHTQAVTLTNQGTDAVRVRARIEEWFLSKDGTPQFKPTGGDAPFSASAWVRLAPPEQVIDPAKGGTVRFTTTVPPGTAEGGYHAAILFEFGPATGDLVGRGRDVVFRSRVATLVYVTVGSPPAVIDLTDLRPHRPEGQPVQILATLHNTGRGHVRTKGKLAIYDGAGKMVREVEVPNVPVLPDSERDVAIPTAPEGQPPLPPGEYRVEVRIDVGLPSLLVGETTLKLAR